MTLAGAVRTTKRTRRTFRGELALSSGPLALAQTGAGTLTDLYGSAWAVALLNGSPVLLQVEGGQWERRDDLGALADLSSAARHVSLAFDQAARPVVAWDALGAVYVRQWGALEGAFVTRGPWPGHDPLLKTDAELLDNVADSDVLLFHLDDPALVVRAQREEYATARPLLDVGAGAVLDQVTVYQHRIQLLGERADGSLLVAHSPVYPVRRFDPLTIFAELSGFFTSVLESTSAADGLAVSVLMSGGLESVSALLNYADTLTVSPSVSGVLAVVVMTGAGSEGLAVASTVSGVLAVVVVGQSTTDGLTVTATIGGTLT